MYIYIFFLNIHTQKDQKHLLLASQTKSDPGISTVTMVGTRLSAFANPQLCIEHLYPLQVDYR